VEHGQINPTEQAPPRAERRRTRPPSPLPPEAAKLTLEQKVALLTGVDNFNLPGEPAIGLRGLVVSDGPAGVRGPVLDPADRSSSPPAPIALAATWDPELVQRVAAQIGAEARAKGVDVLLGPTLNLARSPFGGRGFESFGEDPFLAARTGAAFVRGIQSAGVAATAKHYVGNDAEAERWTADVRIDETTLREVYLAPFEACVTEADCAMIMAGYNLVNGVSMTEHDHLINTVLKGEWGFTGAVVSDWFAARSTEATALAGLDLVMPGPDGPWGQALVTAVAEGRVDESEIDDKLARLLKVAAIVGAQNGARPEPRPGPSADRAVLREAAAKSFVLLRNIGAMLPLADQAEAAAHPAAPTAPSASAASTTSTASSTSTSPSTRPWVQGRGTLPGSIALIGPNVSEPQYQGRGSAEVGMALSVSPAAGLRAALDAAAGSDPDRRPLLRIAQGCRTWGSTPLPESGTISDPETGDPGARIEVYTADGALRYSGVRPVTEVTWWDPEPLVTGPGIGRIVLRSVFTAPKAGRYRAAVGGIGVLDFAGTINVHGDASDGAEPEPLSFGGTAPHPSDPMVSHAGPTEFGHEFELSEGDRVTFAASCEPDGYQHELIRFRAGFVLLPAPDELLREAVEAAAQTDVAVLVVGSAATTESEGYDRESLALPGRQDELIAAVAAVNPHTVVVVNSGMPVLMPWADRVAAIVQAWFPGQEFGGALADVLLGEVEPAGRLPVSIPRSEADLPVGRVVPEGGRIEYAEGPLVGYRGYDSAVIEPLFPFGHGLGYTAWSFERLDVPLGRTRAGADVEVTVAVANLGRRDGRHVVQAYLSGPERIGGPDRRRPLRTLAGFGTAHAAAGAEDVVRIRIPSRAFARWDEAGGCWIHPRGTYRIEIGSSSRELRLRADIEID